MVFKKDYSFAKSRRVSLIERWHSLAVKEMGEMEGLEVLLPVTNEQVKMVTNMKEIAAATMPVGRNRLASTRATRERTRSGIVANNNCLQPHKEMLSNVRNSLYSGKCMNHCDIHG